MSEEKSKLQLIGEIAEANNKNLELIEEIDRLNNKVSELENINEKIGLALDSAENKVDRLNNIILNQQKRIDKTIQAIDEILIYNDVSDTTSAFGNAPRELKFYLSECDTLEEFDKLTALKENNK